MTIEEDLPIPVVEGVAGSLTSYLYLHTFLRAGWWGKTPDDFAPAGSIGGANDALLLTDYGATPGAGVHDNGPKIQAFATGALATGRRHLIPAGIWNLESAPGVPYFPVVDLATAAGPKTVIEFAPGAILNNPNAFGKPNTTLTGTTYFTGAARATKVVTLTVPSGHGVTAGDNFEVYCPTWDFDNGDFTVSSVTATTIVYTQLTAGGTNFASGAAGSHAGFINVHVSCFKVIGGSLSKTLELIRPQFQGPGSYNNPNSTPIPVSTGSGPMLTARVESHGLVSKGFRNGALLSGSDGANSDHYHHYDIKDVGSNFYGLYFRDHLHTGTRDFRFDMGGYGPCQRAGWGISLGAYLSDFAGKDQHFNASPYAIKKEGFRGVSLGSGGGSQIFDDADWSGASKAEGSGNGAWDACEATLEKVGGTFRIHGIETNGAGSGLPGQGGGGANHTLRDITLTAMTRALTVLSATYSRTSAGTSTANSCVITGLTANALTWKDVGCEFIKADVPAGVFVVAILSTTSVLLSDAATGSSTSTCYSVPRLQVGDHITVYTDGDNGATLDHSAIIKTLSGTGTWATGGGGPYTLTAETVASSGTIASTTATAGCIFGMRGGVFQHTVNKLAFSYQSDPSTSDTASEGYWDFLDFDTCRFSTARHPNAHTGYSAFPSVNLRAGSSASLRTVFEFGDAEARLVTVAGTVAAGETTELAPGGSRKQSTSSKAHMRGGEALQPGATTTSHPDGATQTVRPYIWVAGAKGSFRSTSGWPGIKVTGSVANNDILVEDPAGTHGAAKSWDNTSTGLRKIGTATGPDSGGFCPYEVMPGEAWT